MNKFLLIISFWFISLTLISQELPSNRKTDWTIAGNNGIENPDFPIVNFLTFGGFSDGITPNDLLLDNLINTYQTSGVIIYFPNGNYLFNQSIDLKSNMILRGENPDFTTFLFDLGGGSNCINISGNAINLTANLAANTVFNQPEISLVSNPGFQAGDYFLLQEDDSEIVFSDWAIGCAGQVNKIEQVNGNAIISSYPIRRTFFTDRLAAIKKLNLVQNVGIENLTIQRLDATSYQTDNLYFYYAVNCWVSCIKSYDCNFSHIEISNSTNIEVKGSYFKDAFNYGDGGKAYGVNLDYSTGQCLIQNNIFEHLRHSMLAQLGANGNVFAYNYSKNPFWTDVSILPPNSAGDLVLHGNFTYLNLFEGNIVQNIVIDDSHGSNGPYNTFFRNRAELYGIFMNFNPASNNQNFIGNEITNPNLTYGLYSLAGSGHFQYGNNRLGNTLPSGTNNLQTQSLFLSDIPAYYSNTWPPIGLPNTLNENTIEAKERYNNNLLTFCSDEITALEALQSTVDLKVYPSITSGHIEIICDNQTIDQLDKIQLYDRTGKQLTTFEKTTFLNIGNLTDGMYLLHFIFSDHSEITRKIIKQSDSIY